MIFVYKKLIESDKFSNALLRLMRYSNYVRVKNRADQEARRKGRSIIMKNTKNISFALVLVVMALLTSVCMPVFADSAKTEAINEAKA